MFGLLGVQNQRPEQGYPETVLTVFSIGVRRKEE